MYILTWNGVYIYKKIQHKFHNISTTLLHHNIMLLTVFEKVYFCLFVFLFLLVVLALLFFFFSVSFAYLFLVLLQLISDFFFQRAFLGGLKTRN